uniref:UDP-glucuronosyltransferase n=1 Tax=Lepisosteus oculatus TaxID=7918 RepID=W5NN56_LEPOC
MQTCGSWKTLPTLISLLIIISVPFSDGGKILVFPVDGSHWVNMNILIEEMHSRGHNITVIRGEGSWYIKENSLYYTSITIPENKDMDNKFFHSFLVKYLEVQIKESSLLTFLTLKRDFLAMISEVHRAICKMVTTMFENKQLMQRLQDTQYDLVLTDPAIAGGVLLAHYLKLPLVLNVRWITSGEGHFALAPSPLSYIPVPGSRFSDQMNVIERVKNFLYYAIILYEQTFVVDPHYRAVCDHYFGPGIDIYSLIQSADIWLMRVDFVFEFPRPTMPNVVYMGGFQCKPAKPLSPDLEEFMQSSGKHGVIIMSLGTLVNSLPIDIANEIASAFAQLPQKVIWRHQGNRPANLGNNTLLVNWMSQNDLLGHPKTRVFVAHGGTNGVQEAIYHGIPVLGLPLLFDQYDNLLRLKGKGAAKILEINKVKSNTFLQALLEVLNDPSYQMNMKKLSSLHWDQPIRPLDNAAFWIEYVIRHKGAAHLHSESYKMPWYTYHSVDVIMFLLAAVFVFIMITIAVIKFICHRIYYRRKLKSE